jgi:ankyrin repeat protein
MDRLKENPKDRSKRPNRNRLQEEIQNHTLSKYPLKKLKKWLLETPPSEKHLPLRDQRNNEGETLYHWAAKKGFLGHIPEQLLKTNLLLTPDEFGYNCFQIAARNGALDKVPQRLLTQENLAEHGERSENTFHMAAEAGHLDKIPKEILTAENLLQPDMHGETCLHLAADQGHLDKLPRLSKETLKELKTHFETKDSSYYKEEILETLKGLEFRRPQTLLQEM